jgi:hypothetical protein
VLFPHPLHARIESGEITLAFRSWLRPTVRAGGTLVTPAGLLAIDAVDVIEPGSITAADALRAGATDVAEVIAGLATGDGRRLHRIEFRRAGDDPRLARRVQVELTDAEWSSLIGKLDGMDARSPTGPWTTAALRAIADHPAVVSTVLAEQVGLPRPEFKLRVRRLKALGLTESLEVGYRLSLLGAALLGRRPG